MKTAIKIKYCLFSICILAFLPGVFAQADATRHPLVGTWEFISATTADGKENQAYSKAFQGIRAIKMITPTHYVILYIDRATGRITGAHGGACWLGDGQLTECTQYSTTPSADQSAKTTPLKVRYDGDRFIQSFEGGGSETWCRASTSVVSGATTLGQQLIDLQKAKEAGAITDAEYKAQKAKLLEKK